MSESGATAYEGGTKEPPQLSTLPEPGAAAPGASCGAPPADMPSVEVIISEESQAAAEEEGLAEKVSLFPDPFARGRVPQRDSVRRAGVHGQHCASGLFELRWGPVS